MTDPFKLTDVEVTDKELGRGSFGVVSVVFFKGLKCAGKIIYKSLCENNSRIVPRFKEECVLLSQLHHPNIVQFLGTYSENESDIPIMVMELLPTNLTGCLATYEILPEEVSYSILQDVALGLHYLHTRTPSVIHRDLSANNVLLSPDMTAKISDLGVAKILNFSLEKVATMTKVPGTLAYMPPEALVDEPKYDASIDEFSYGIMMVHVLVGQWPTVQCAAVKADSSGQLLPVSEADRRAGYLEAIGLDHPLMSLIRKCLHNIPEQRARSSEIVKRLKEVAKTKPQTFLTRLEMLKQIEADKEQKRMMMKEKKNPEESGNEIDELKQQHELELERIKSETQQTLEQRRKKQLRSSLAQSSEVAQLKEKLASANTAKKAHENENKALSNEIDILKQGAKKQREQLDTTIETYQKEIEGTQKRKDIELTTIRKEMEALRTEASKIRIKNDRLKLSFTLKQQEITRANGSLVTKRTEVEQKKAIIDQNATTIQVLNEHLTRTREYLSVQAQPIQAEIEWKKCESSPAPMSQSSTTVVEGKVYCTTKDSIFCYDPFNDLWLTSSALPPPLQVIKFGLGQLGGRLVAVGGLKKPDNVMVTNDILVFEPHSRLGTTVKKWKHTIASMPTARHSPTVVSCRSLLIVAGGISSDKESIVVLDTIEIYNNDTSQWSAAKPLPFPQSNMSSVVIADKLFLVGGISGRFKTYNKAIYASIDNLLKESSLLETSKERARSTVYRGSPRVEKETRSTVYRGSPRVEKETRQVALSEPPDVNSVGQPIWKMIADTPHYGSTGVNVTDSLLVVGGETTNAGKGSVVKSMYAYSSKLDMWVKLGTLPEACLLSSVATLSPSEFVLIGGLDANNDRSQNVYRGSLKSVYN